MPLGIRMTIILDKKPLSLKSFYFDLTWKLSFFFPPVLSLLYVIWYLIFWVHPKSSPILLQKSQDKKKFIFLEMSYYHQTDDLPASPPWAHSRNSAMKPTFKMGPPEIDKKKHKTKPRLAGGVCRSQPHLKWHVRGILTNSNLFPLFRSAVTVKT